MIATKKRVGRKDWLRLEIGEVGVFTLPDHKAREAARVAVSHLRHKYGHDFEYIDLEIKESAKAEVEEWLGVSSVYRNGDKIFASAKLPYDGGLISKLLGFGNSVRILAPEKLKRDVISVAKQLVSEYEKTGEK